MAQPTQTMLKVLKECFDNDWEKMLAYAQNYDPNRAMLDNSVHLGAKFRKIIGSRQRERFWNTVKERETPFSTNEESVDADSLKGILHAIERCQEGEETQLFVNGRLIGKVVCMVQA